MKILTIGKAPICDIVIPPSGDGASASRFHADLVLSKGRHAYMLVDRNSTNGTFIFNNSRWERIRQVLVSPDSQIMIGRYKTSVGELVSRAGLKYDNATKTIDGGTNHKSMKVKIGSVAPYRNPETGEIVI